MGVLGIYMISSTLLFIHLKLNNRMLMISDFQLSMIDP